MCAGYILCFAVYDVDFVEPFATSASIPNGIVLASYLEYSEHGNFHYPFDSRSPQS